MKKFMIIITVMLLIVVGGIFFINEKEEDTDVTKKQTKVGFLLNGSKNDKNYGQSHYEGMEKTAAALNLSVKYREHVPETEQCIEIVEELIEEGCEIIIANSFGFGEWLMQAAEKHPDIYFFHATGVDTCDNMATYFGRIYQMRYLSGIVAGLQTETNEIGYVAAFPISEVNRGINAFTLGVREVNPDAKVYVKWSNSWTDDEQNEEATKELLDTHNIDVLAVHMDSLKPFELAEQRGVWLIGYNMDNSKDFPNTFLTAPVWQWEKFYEPRILECLQGKFRGKHYWEGIKSGIAKLAPFTENVKEGIAEIVEEKKKELESERVDVFYGPIYDNEGKLRVPEGESMTDEVMLNQFDWYVEGVVIYE